MSESGVSWFPQPSPKDPKLHGESAFPGSLPTGKSQHTTPISPPSLTPNSSDAHLPDNPDALDIDDFEAFRRFGPHAVPEDPRCQKRLHECLDFVVNEYNRLMKSNSELVQAKIVKAIRVYASQNIRFFITFEADDTVTEQHVTYQTDVLSHPDSEKLIFFIGEEGQNKEFLYPVDLHDRNEINRMNKCAVAAIASYNDEQQEEPRLEFVKIVKAVKDVMRLAYRMSIEAWNPESHQIGTYYAEATNFWGDDLEAVCFVRKDGMKDDFFFKLRDDPLRVEWHKVSKQQA